MRLPSCLKGMKAAGLNPKNAEDRQRYAEDTYHEWVRDMSEQVRSFNPDYNIFYNKGHVGRVDKPVLDNYTYAAFESLPGGLGDTWISRYR
ncbi:hypothetical protein [Cohnella faecalis]|uniref:hypothetical protein n=1 Tax=Cohnella faecalis TaxID=2315694 RepID=UPI0018F53A8F|nr:hypothetical protein [Cohnella faecalis]